VIQVSIATVWSKVAIAAVELLDERLKAIEHQLTSEPAIPANESVRRVITRQLSER
jgi:hypothetical protein